MIRVRHLRRFALLACLAVPVLGPSARAGILGPDSGNTTAASQNNPGANSVAGSINFAVYKNGGGSGNDVFGTGFANLDTSGVTTFNTKSTTGGPAANTPLDSHAKYLYVYQVSNNGPGHMSFNLTLPVNAAKVTSFGVLFNGKTPLGFTDSQGLVSGQYLASKGANNLGPETFSGGANSHLTGFTPNAPGNLIGSNVGGFNPGIANNPHAFSRISLDLQGSDLLVDFPHGSLKSGSTSELFYFTSNMAPSLFFGSLLNDDGMTALGQFAGPSPRVVPAPPSLVLCLLGVALFGVFHGFRRRRTTKATLSA
jgi:hypothetical protein